MRGSARHLHILVSPCKVSNKILLISELQRIRNIPKVVCGEVGKKPCRATEIIPFVPVHHPDDTVGFNHSEQMRGMMGRTRILLSMMTMVKSRTWVPLRLKARKARPEMITQTLVDGFGVAMVGDTVRSTLREHNNVEK